MKSILAILVVVTAALLLNSCETLAPEETGPPRERLSSMPQNLPQSWEGQAAGFPGTN